MSIGESERAAAETQRLLSEIHGRLSHHGLTATFDHRYVWAGDRKILWEYFAENFDEAMIALVGFTPAMFAPISTDDPVDDNFASAGGAWSPAGDPQTSWWGRTEPGQGYAGQGGVPIWERSG